MTPTLQPTTRIRLEKAAMDNGFDQELPRDSEWLGFASTRSPLWVWLSVAAAGGPLVAFSQLKVAMALAASASATDVPLPLGARGAVGVADVPALHALLRRAFQLSRTLPDEPLRVFEARAKALPRTTEAERLVLQRVGQDVFRGALLEYWEGRCAITGLAVPELLRASHIKPWADCESDAERLDVFNGLLLAPQMDAAIDRGFVTVADDGAVVVAGVLDAPARTVLGLDRPLRVAALADGHREYLPWHRTRVFKNGSGRG